MRQLRDHLRHGSGTDFGAYEPTIIRRRRPRRILDTGADAFGV